VAYFVSYSRIDGQGFALWLVEQLTASSPPIPVWLDQSELRPGQDWDTQLLEAIRECRALLFVMTPESVGAGSACKLEWTAALKYKKPVIPLRVHREVELPVRLESRQFIDFTGSRDEGLARLRQYLTWMDSPEGALQALLERLSDAERDARRSRTPAEQARVQGEIEQLQRQIIELRRLLADPGAAHQSAEQRIASGLERERAPERPVTVGHARFLNPPPMLAPAWFQDRHVETQLVEDFLRMDGLRLLTVVGRGGLGKTALVVRVLQAVEGGQLLDDRGPFVVDAIVYLSPVGSHKVSFTNLAADLSRLLPEEVAERLRQRQDPQQSVQETMSALLEAFSNQRIVVLLDSFEDMIDAKTLEVADPALDEALRSLLLAPAHGLKVILTTRVAPRSLLLVQPARQRVLDLNAGLGSPHAENLLRAMDPDGTLGLRDAPDDQLSTARERTRGSPRALEALMAILAADRHTSLAELLAETGGLLPDNVTDVLVGEAFNRLDQLAQQVMEALAIYGPPVPAVAVDYLLQPYAPAIDSVPVLARLVNMQFVRRDADRYYLEQVDRDYTLSRIPVGHRADRDTNPPPFTQDALRARGARFFENIRLPREAAKQLDDLWPQLAEFELQCALDEYDAAARLVLTIEDQLLAWGHLDLLGALHERLQGRLGDPELRRTSLASLHRARQLFRPPDGQPLEQGGLRLQSTLRGHTAPVTRLAWLPDGQRLLSASLDGIATRCWRLRWRQMGSTPSQRRLIRRSGSGISGPAMRSGGSPATPTR